MNLVDKTKFSCFILYNRSTTVSVETECKCFRWGQMAVNSLNRLPFFIIRADIKQYIGLPSVNAIFSIYHSCITELMRVTNLISTSYKKKIHF